MRNKSRRYLPLLGIVVMLCAFASDAFSQKKGKQAKPTTATVTVRTSLQTAGQKATERRQEAFFAAWSTLNLSYYDKTFGGLDWNKIRVEYAAKVARAKTDAEFHLLLAEMIKRLGRSHLNIIVPEYFDRIAAAKRISRAREKELAAEKAGDVEGPDETEDAADLFGTRDKRYGIGVGLRMMGGQMVITSIEEQSGALLAGLKAGYAIEKINGVSIRDTISQATLSGVSANDLQYLLPLEVINEFLNGESGSSVFLTVLDENDKPKEVTVPRLELAGETISLSKNLPEHFLQYESRSLSEDVGYIRFSAFAVPVVGKFCDSLSEFSKKKAIVIDLRDNLGGIIVSMIGLSGMLTDKQITLGTFVSRSASQKFTVESKLKNFKGRIVLLVNGQSMSAAEMFTAGLQANRRALVVGEKTGGKSLPAVWTKLATGAVMVYPISDFHTLAGRSLEGDGISPDHFVELDRKSLLTGVDTQLQRAISVAGDDKAFAAINAAPPSPPLVNSSESPPPPKPRPSPAENILVLPPPPVAKIAPKSTPPSADERSLKIIGDFANAIGGLESVKSFGSYEAKGRMVTSSTAETEGDFYTVHISPDKTAVIIRAANTGEIRTVYNGKQSFQQAEYGLNYDMKSVADPTRVDLFAPYFSGLDINYLKGLRYEGEYEVEGRLRYVLSATSPEGYAIGLSFDVVTKLLATFSMPGILYTFSDYRKVDGVLIPFHLDGDRIMNIRLETVTRNPKIDMSVFDKKENCYDKPISN